MKPYYTIKVTQEHMVALEGPGDFVGEFIRDISATLLRASEVDDEPETVVGEMMAMLIRGGSALNFRHSIWEEADAHSGDAEAVASAVFGRYHTRIEDHLEEALHDVLYIEEFHFLEEGLEDTDLDRWFLMRFADQFDVDLIVVDAKYKRALGIGFEKMPGSSNRYLMRDAHRNWPTTPLIPLGDPLPPECPANDVVVH